MTRTITALFDERHDAEAAQARLTQATVDVAHVHIHDKTTAGYDDTTAGAHGAPGIWEKIKHVFLPDADRHVYEEGVRRGGFLLSADVDDDAVAEVVRIFEEAETVDIDDRAEQWRTSGWDAAPTGPPALIEGRRDRVVGRRDMDRGNGRVRSYIDEPFTQE